MADIEERILFLGGLAEKLKVSHRHRRVENHLALFFGLVQNLRGLCESQHRPKDREHKQESTPDHHGLPPERPQFSFAPRASSFGFDSKPGTRNPILPLPLSVDSVDESGSLDFLNQDIIEKLLRFHLLRVGTL